MGKLDIQYATSAEVAAYMGIAENELPTNVNVLIKRASEIITIGMRGNYDSTNADHIEVVKLATCAQIQDWIEREVSAVANQNIQSYSLGSLSMTYASNDSNRNKLCITSARYLNTYHLLYKG
jgi:hypothetical protein